MYLKTQSGKKGQKHVCATCGEGFITGSEQVIAYTPSTLELGLICPICRQSSPQQLRQRIQRYAYLLRLKPRYTNWDWVREQQRSPTEYANELDRVIESLSKPKGVLAWLQSILQRFQR
jgi:hypothetical protein